MDDKEKEIEDLKKALWYINNRIKQLEDDRNWLIITMFFVRLKACEGE